MRVTRRDIKVILLLIGILSAFITYQFYFKTKLDDISAQEDKITGLKAEIEDLQKKKAFENQYRKQMGDQEAEVDAKISEFPADQWYENGILFLNYMEKRPELFEDRDPIKIYFKKYGFTEATDIANIVGQLNTVERRIALRDATTKAEFICNYDALKEMIRIIYGKENTDDTDSKTRRMIRSMDLEVKWNGNFPLEGKIEFSSFAMNDAASKNRTYVPVKVPGYEEVYQITQVEGKEYVPHTAPETDPDTNELVTDPVTGETKMVNDDIIGIDCVFGDLTPTTEAVETSSEEALR